MGRNTIALQGRQDHVAAIAAGDDDGVVAAGFERAADDTLGELELSVYLGQGLPSGTNDDAAAGWAGDELVVYTRAEERAVVELRVQPDRVGVMGAVGRAILNKLGLKADIEFGISRASALAASRGLNVFVLVVGRMVNRVVEEIDSTNMKNAVAIIYEVKDATT